MCFPPPPQPLLPPLHPPGWPGLVALAVGALYRRVDLAKPGVRGTSIIIQPCVSACRRQLLVLAMLVLLPLTNDITLKLLANLQFKSDSYVNINKYGRRASSLKKVPSYRNVLHNTHQWQQHQTCCTATGDLYRSPRAATLLTAF